MLNSQFDIFGSDFNLEAVNNGYFTIENTKTGEWRTFRIQKQKEHNRLPTGAQVLSLLVGPENTTQYRAFAFINTRGAFSFKKLREKSGVWQAYCNLVHSLLTEGAQSRYYTERKYVIRQSERCFMCGRMLTTPESIEMGIGPVCANR